MSSFEKLFSEEQLLMKEEFYSNLYQKDIADKDDERANVIWNSM